MPKNKTTGQKLADLMYGSPDKPAFGVYPMIAKRREDRQDREAAKNFPVDLGRGAFAGAAGLAGDIESLGRLPYVLYTGNESPTFAPTSEEILQRLPYGSDSPVGQFASGLGTLAGGSVPFNVIPKVIKAGAKGAMAAGRAGERMAEKYVPQIMERGGVGADLLSGMAHGTRSQIFIGPNAKTFNKAKADAATALEQAGVDPVDIWRQTGTFRGADGIMRQEISDAGAIYRNPEQLKELGREKKEQALALKQRLVTPIGQKDMFPKALTEAKKPVREEAKRLKEEADVLGRYSDVRGQPAKFVYEHPDLYKAYPELADVQVYQGGRGTMGEQASMRGSGPDLEMEITQKGLKADPKSSLLHEMQHGVQNLEGMAPGGNTVTAFQNPEALKILGDMRLKANTPMSFEDFVKKGGYGDDQETLARAAEEYKDYAEDVPALAKKYDLDTQRTAAMEYYKRLAGEAEARASQAREPMGMAERSQEFPYSSYDVLPEDLIVKPAKDFAAGGNVHFSDNPDTMALELAGGGKVGLLTEAATKLAKALKPAEAPMKASEALGRIEGRPLVITQADRTKVGGGYLGGPGFSGLQLTEPEYRAAEAAWGVKTPGVAKMILGGSKSAGKDPVYAAMLGTPTQHQSNQMVFDKLYGDFKKAAKKGDLDSDLRDRINMRLVNTVDKEGNNIFPPDVDILSKNFKDLANTFDRRAVTANLIGGMGVGGKKGQIIDYDKIIRDTTDPLLIDSPTGALGNRLFTLSGGIIDRPDLHPAFPTIMQGEDLGVSFSPVARDLIMKDFTEKTMREKGRAPGYMDYTRGYPPSQLITEDILTEMQKLGLKEGGAVTSPAAKIDGNDFVLVAKKYGLDDSMRTLNKIVSLVNQGATVDEAARIVSDATVRFSDNPDTMALELAGGGKVGAVTNLIKGFFSAVDKTAQNLKRPAGTGKEFMAEVKAAPGIKATELKGRKLAEIEAMPKMTKAEFIKELEARPPVKIEEKVLSEPSQKDIDVLADKLAYEKGRDEAYEFSNRGDDIDAMAEENYRLSLKFDWPELQERAREQLREGKGSSFHQQYVIPGGENYREILLKMPAAAGEGFPGAPAHFGGEPNILASIRVSDRIGPNGEKILHVEEIQSDWHQKGRQARAEEVNRLVKSGMSKQEAQAAVPEDYGYSTNMAARRKELGDRYKSGELSLDQYDYLDRELTSVPDAPFKKDWQELALRKVMQEAAEGGYDKVALTPGAEQAARYDLSQHVDQIAYNPSTGYFTATKEGQPVADISRLTPTEVVSHIGQEATDKLLQSPANNIGLHVLSGEDLKVGGEGMKGFYDKMLPDYLNKLGKQYGVQVDQIGIRSPDGRSDAAMKLGVTPQDYAAMSPEEKAIFHEKLDDINAKPLHSFEVTPQMREDINTKGQPLYSKIGIPGAEAAGATTIGSQIFDENNEQQVQNPIQFTDNPDAMRLELMQRN